MSSVSMTSRLESTATLTICSPRPDAATASSKVISGFSRSATLRVTASTSSCTRRLLVLLHGARCVVYGDGETSRDFCYIENVLQMNLLAASAAPNSPAVNQIYNVAFGGRTTLKQLFFLIRERLAQASPAITSAEPEYQA